MTPAMEEVARLKNKSLQLSNEESKATLHVTVPRLTRSRVAHLKSEHSEFFGKDSFAYIFTLTQFK